MRKLYHHLSLAAASLFLAMSAASCLQEDTPMEGNDGKTTMTAVASVGKPDDETKSSIVSDSQSYAFERTLKNVTVFQFRNGILDNSYYATGSGGTIYIDVTGDTGESYVFYALGNCGNLTESYARGTSLQEFLTGMEIRYDNPVSGIASSGIPMFCGGSTISGGLWDGVPATFTEGNSFALTFIRLTARFNFALDISALRYGTFTPTSLELAQSPKCVVPFMESSAPSSASDFTSGDHSSAEDLSTLSSGVSVPFYVLENARGTLLQGNSDPWKKVPTSIPSESGKCTYLELTGTYTDKSGGLTAEHTYRMYLGKDNRTNFDICRNYENTLTLTLSDDGFLRGSWKMERNILSDTRTMEFEQDIYEVLYDTPVMAKLITSGNIGVSYSLSQNLLDAGVTYDATTRTLSQSMKLDADVTGTLTATSWDRVHTATAQVIAKKYTATPTVIITPQVVTIYRGGTPEAFDYEFAGDETIHYEINNAINRLDIPFQETSAGPETVYRKEGKLYVSAPSNVSLGTYTMTVCNADNTINETRTIKVLSNTISEAPVGLTDITVDVSRLHNTSSGSAMIHDPSCPLNHDLYTDVESFVAISDCPNWHTSTVPNGRAGVISASFKVGYNYSVNSSGQLVCSSYLTPGTDFDVVQVNLVGDDGHICEATQMSDPVYDTASGAVTLSGQFADGSLSCFEVKIVTKGNKVRADVRTYLISFAGHVVARDEGKYFNDEELSAKYKFIDNSQDRLMLYATLNTVNAGFWIHSNNIISKWFISPDYENTYDLEISFTRLNEFPSSSYMMTDKVFTIDRRAVVIREDELSDAFPSVEIIENKAYKNNINNYPTALMFSNQLKMALYAGFRDARLSFDYQDVYCYDDVDNPGNYDEYDQNDNFVRSIPLTNSTQSGDLTTSWSDNIFTGRTYYHCGPDWEFINVQVPNISVSSEHTVNHKLTIRNSEWTWEKMSN